MADFPNIPEINKNNYWKYIPVNENIYNFPWGEKIYGFKDGTLSALYPIAVIYYPTPEGRHAYIGLWANVAGQGECLYPIDADFFESIVDYENCINDGYTGLIWNAKDKHNTIFNIIDSVYDEFSISRKEPNRFGPFYYISGFETSQSIIPIETEMKISMMTWDEKGLHIQLADNGKQFLLYEDAAEAQKKLHTIVDFDEVPASPGQTK